MNDITRRFIDTYEKLKKLGILKNDLELATKLNKSPSTMLDLQKNRTNVGIDLLQKFTELYKNVNPGWILSGVGDQFFSDIPEKSDTNSQKSVISKPSIEINRSKSDKKSTKAKIVYR